jgi:hypothetical protein
MDALDAETKRLRALADLPAPARPALQESGVLHRTYVDTIENVVGVVEVLGNGVFRASVPNADALLKGKGKVFQRLDDLAELFIEHLGIDLRSVVGSQWPSLVRAWAARHVFTHCDGVVDGSTSPRSRRRPRGSASTSRSARTTPTLPSATLRASVGPSPNDPSDSERRSGTARALRSGERYGSSVPLVRAAKRD